MSDERDQGSRPDGQHVPEPVEPTLSPLDPDSSPWSAAGHAGWGPPNRPDEPVLGDLHLHPPIFDNRNFSDLRERLFGDATPDDYPVVLDLPTPVALPDEVSAAAAAAAAVDLQPADLHVPPVGVGPAPSVEASSTPAPSPWLAQPTAPNEATPPRPLDPSRNPHVEVGVAAAASASAGTSVLTAPFDGADALDDRDALDDTSPNGIVIDWTSVSPSYAPRDSDDDSNAKLIGMVALAAVILAVAAYLFVGPNRPRETPTADPSRSQAGATLDDAGAVGAIGLTSDVDITRDLTVVVHQDIVFKNPVSQVTLSVPEKVSIASGDFDITIDHLTVTTSGLTVDANADDPLFSGDTATIGFPDPTRTFSLDYEVADGVINAKPVKAGRGIALTSVLDIDGDQTKQLTSQINVNGPRVLELECLIAGSLDPCGTDEGEHWSYDIIGRANVTVFAEIDLPD